MAMSSSHSALISLRMVHTPLQAAAKRQIAIFKANGEIPDAISALVRYLDTSYNDPESWLELCSLYLSQRMYQQAAFCVEELLLLQGSNHVWHLKYAEILYTMGEVALALKEYCRVIELCEDHLRGMYGVQLVSGVIVFKKKEMLFFKGRGTNLS